MFDRASIRQGMTVFSSDGEKLGTVIQCDVSTFIIEKGLFFKKDYVVRFEDVTLVAGDEIRLSRGRELLGEPVGRGDDLAQGPASLLSGGGGLETVPTTGRIPREQEEEEVASPRRPAANQELPFSKERPIERRAADQDEEQPVVNLGEDSGAIGRRDPDDEP
jgi:hypothetical protein